MAFNVGYENPDTSWQDAARGITSQAMQLVGLEQDATKIKNQSEQFAQDLALRRQQEKTTEKSVAESINRGEHERNVAFPESKRQFNASLEQHGIALENELAKIDIAYKNLKLSASAMLGNTNAAFEVQLGPISEALVDPKTKKVPGLMNAVMEKGKNLIKEFAGASSDISSQVAVADNVFQTQKGALIQQHADELKRTQDLAERQQNLAEVSAVMNTANSMGWNADRMNKWSTTMGKHYTDTGQTPSPLMQDFIDLFGSTPPMYSTPQEVMMHAINNVPDQEKLVKIGALIADSYGLGPNTPIEKAKQQAISIFNNAQTLKGAGKFDDTDVNDPFVQGVIQNSPSGMFDLEGVTNYVLQSQRDGDYGSIGGLIMETQPGAIKPTIEEKPKVKEESKSAIKLDPSFKAENDAVAAGKDRKAIANMALSKYKDPADQELIMQWYENPPVVPTPITVESKAKEKRIKSYVPVKLPKGIQP